MAWHQDTLVGGTLATRSLRRRGTAPRRVARHLALAPDHAHSQDHHPPVPAGSCCRWVGRDRLATGWSSPPPAPTTSQHGFGIQSIVLFGVIVLALLGVEVPFN